MGGKFEDVGGEEAGASAELDTREGEGVAELVPHVGELDGEEGAKGGMGPGAGIEVAFGAYAVGTRGVIAEGRVIEGQLHESGEGDGTAATGLFDD